MFFQGSLAYILSNSRGGNFGRESSKLEILFSKVERVVRAESRSRFNGVEGVGFFKQLNLIANFTYVVLTTSSR